MSEYKVWYVPQVPMKAFEVQVDDLETAQLIEQVLYAFSQFEYHNRVKPDYSDTGGIAVLVDGEWEDVDEEVDA